MTALLLTLTILSSVLGALAAAIYAGAFRAPENVRVWETQRENRAVAALAVLACVAATGAVAVLLWGQS